MLNSLSQQFADRMTMMMKAWVAAGPLACRDAIATMAQPADPGDNVVQTDLDAEGLPIRLYRPAEAMGTPPCLIYYHGGGFVTGGLDSYDRLCHRLARLAGIAVASVDYRLAPEHRYPAAVEDALSAYLWILENADGIGIDRNRLALGGDSAGGTLALTTALQLRDRGAARPRHLLLLYPGLDLVSDTASKREFGDGYALDSDLQRMFIDAYVPDAAQRSEVLASPLRAGSVADLPPTTLLLAQCDPLRDDGIALADRLRSAAVPVESLQFEGVFHGFASLLGMLPEADQAVAAAAKALRQALSEHVLV